MYATNPNYVPLLSPKLINASPGEDDVPLSPQMLWWISHPHMAAQTTGDVQMPSAGGNVPAHPHAEEEEEEAQGAEEEEEERGRNQANESSSTQYIFSDAEDSFEGHSSPSPVLGHVSPLLRNASPPPLKISLSPSDRPGVHIRFSSPSPSKSLYSSDHPILPYSQPASPQHAQPSAPTRSTQGEFISSMFQDKVLSQLHLLVQITNGLGARLSNVETAVSEIKNSLSITSDSEEVPETPQDNPPPPSHGNQPPPSTPFPGVQPLLIFSMAPLPPPENITQASTDPSSPEAATETATNSEAVTETAATFEDAETSPNPDDAKKGKDILVLTLAA